MPEIRLPRKFFDDHESRDLDTPKVVRSNSRYVYVDSDDPAMGELISDAEYYAESTQGWQDDSVHWVYAARTLLHAIRRQEGK